MDRSETFSHLCDLCVHTDSVQVLEQAFSRVRDINASDASGHTPIFYAVTRNEEPRILDALIRRGACLDCQLLCEAVKHNPNPQIAITIYHAIAPLTNQELNYLFLLSAAHRHDQILPAFFVEKGASRDATLGLDIYPDFDWDDESEDKMPEYLLVEENALVFALYENPDPYAMLPSLLDLGVNIDFIDREGHSVLYHALDDIDLTRLLVERGCDLHTPDPNEKTALMLACEGENCEVALYLIEKDSRIDAVCCEGRSALHYALSLHFTNNHEVVRALLEHGADVLACDERGHAPIDYARRYYARRETIVLLERAIAEAEASLLSEG